MKRLLVFFIAAFIAVSLLLGCGGKGKVKRTTDQIKKDAERLYKELKKEAK